MTTVDLEQQRLLIGGEWVPASGDATFSKPDPFTGATVTLAAAAGAEDARRACDAAAAAFPGWAAAEPGERRRLLLAAADLLMDRHPAALLEPERLVEGDGPVDVADPVAGVNELHAP